MSKKYIVQRFECYITEYEVKADSEEEAKTKFDNEEYKMINEYYLDGHDTWGEVILEEEQDKKKLHWILAMYVWGV